MLAEMEVTDEDKAKKAAEEQKKKDALGEIAAKKLERELYH